MRPRTEYERVAELLREGWNDCQIARATGIPRTTIGEWRTKGRPGRYLGNNETPCPICEGGEVPRADYAYLLGLYLGDGHIVRVGRVWCLRVFQDMRYRRLIRECATAMEAVSGRRVNVVEGRGYPRYEFSNRSDDIRSIFTTTCESYGLSWTRPNKSVISIAKARDVARLDLIIGPKS